MALKPCRECMKEVSDQAEFCPNCGIRSPASAQATSTPGQDATSAVKPKGGAAKGCLTFVVILVVIVGVIAAIGSNSTPTPGPTPVASSQEAPAPAPAPAPISVRDFISSFAGGGVLDIPSEESGNYGDLCRQEWTKAGELDQEEYAYCVSQEQEGYNELAALARNYSDMPNAQALLDSTEAQWTKNGDRDDNEVQFVFGQQISDFKDFKWLAFSPGFNEDEGQQCLNQWTSGSPQTQDWSEIDYCYKQFPDFRMPTTSN